MKLRMSHYITQLIFFLHPESTMIIKTGLKSPFRAPGKFRNTRKIFLPLNRNLSAGCLLLLLSISSHTATAADENKAAAAHIDSSTIAEMSDAEVQQLFEQAMQERDTGEVFSAIQKFEYILSRRPSLNRARLELAVSYHRATRYQDASEEFQAVLDNPETPESVRLSILAYLAQLNSDKSKPDSEHLFSYYTKAGMLYNSNINFAPLRGSPVYQIPDGQDTSSPGLDTFFSASHRYSRKKPVDAAGTAAMFEWQSQASWTGNNYTRNSDFNLNILSLSTGPALVSSGHWRGTVSIQVDQTYFGSNTLGTFVSLNPLITLDLGNYQGITIEASYTMNDFAQALDNPRDGDTVLAGIAYSSLFANASNGFEIGIRQINQSADDPQFGFSSTEIYAGGFYSTSQTSSFSLNLHLQQYDFDAADTVTGSIRDELESRFSFGYNYDFNQGLLTDWTLNAYVSRTKNNSNIDAFSYERTIVGINLARFFL